MFCRLFRNQKAFHNFFRIALDPRNRPSLPSRHLTKRGLSDGHPLLSGFAIRQRNRNRSGLSADQSLPETVQVLRPPGTWTVPGAFFLRADRRPQPRRLQRKQQSKCSCDPFFSSCTQKAPHVRHTTGPVAGLAPQFRAACRRFGHRRARAGTREDHPRDHAGAGGLGCDPGVGSMDVQLRSQTRPACACVRGGIPGLLARSSFCPQAATAGEVNATAADRRVSSTRTAALAAMP